MAARRLVIIMLVLLGLSALLAVQLPRQKAREARQGTETTATDPGQTTTPAAPAPAAAEPAKAKIPRGEGKGATIVIDPKEISVVPVVLGDQLSLLVKSLAPTDLVEIPALGLIDSVTPDKPATFNVFADRAGDYGIRLVEGDRVIGRIEVKPPAREERARAKSTDLP